MPSNLFEYLLAPFNFSPVDILLKPSTFDYWLFVLNLLLLSSWDFLCCYPENPLLLCLCWIPTFLNPVTSFFLVYSLVLVEYILQELSQKSECRKNFFKKWCVFENVHNILTGFRISDWKITYKIKKALLHWLLILMLEHTYTMPFLHLTSLLVICMFTLLEVWRSSL